MFCASARAQSRARSVGHQVIDLREAPREIPVEHDVHAAARGQRERALRAPAGHVAVRVHAAHQKLRKRHEVIEVPVVQAWAEQIRLQAALGIVRGDAPRKAVISEFAGQSQPAVAL